MVFFKKHRRCVCVCVCVCMRVLHLQALANVCLSMCVFPGRIKIPYWISLFLRHPNWLHSSLHMPAVTRRPLSGLRNRPPTPSSPPFPSLISFFPRKEGSSHVSEVKERMRRERDEWEKLKESHKVEMQRLHQLSRHYLAALIWQFQPLMVLNSYTCW